MTIHDPRQEGLPFATPSVPKQQRKIVFNTGAVRHYPDETLEAMIAVQNGRAGECFSLRPDQTKRSLRTHVIDFTNPDTARQFIDKHGVLNEGDDSKTLSFQSARFLILPPQRGLHEDGLALKPIKLTEDEVIMPIVTDTAAGYPKEQNQRRLQLVVTRELQVVPIQKDLESDPQSYRLFVKQAMPLASVSLDPSFKTVSSTPKAVTGYAPTA